MTLLEVSMQEKETCSPFAVRRYMRHEYDIPACWFDLTYLKVRPNVHSVE